jgi:vancomycin permeability regulator SanA
MIFLAASLPIVLAGLHDNLQPADAAVVLGSKVNADGHPSVMLQARLDHAVALYYRGYFRLILVSGGHGKEGYDEPSVMRRYLEARGIPPDCILEDDAGNTTWLTAQHTARLVQDEHLHSILIVTQYFHMPRCRLAFARAGIRPVYWSHARFWSIRDIYSVPREAVGCIYYLVRPYSLKAKHASPPSIATWQKPAPC